MDRTEMISRIERVTATVLKIDSKEITPTANFAFDLGADSMQTVELIAAFEEEFNVEMDESKAREVQTVSDAADFIAGYLK
jgi:acyl carrier protein